MKCVQVTKYGEDEEEILRLETNAPSPTPKDDELLVKVMACALNPADCKLMNGDIKLVMNPKSFPYVPGLDIAGVVEQVGTKCKEHFSVGDKVIAPLKPLEIGGLAEVVAVPWKLAAKMPSSISFEQACGLPTAAATAMQAVKDARITKGSRVMVLGGSGGVGTFVVQIAKAFGSSFVAATSTNDTLVRSLGADQVFDYREEKKWYHHFGATTDTTSDSGFATEKFDAVIDCVGDEDSFHNCAAALKPRGARYITIVGAKPDARITTVWELFRFMGPVLSRNLFWPFGYSHGFHLVSCFPIGKDLEPIVELVDQGKLRVVLDPVSPLAFTLRNVLEGIRVQKSHRAKGKIVIKVASE